MSRRGPTTATTVGIEIEIVDPLWLKPLRTARAICRSAATLAIAGAATRDRAVSLTIVLSSDAAVRRLNRDFRHKDKPTNVLSFPAGDHATAPGAPRHLGDIVLARQTVLREACRQHKRQRDHLAHLVVHGTLHLLGFDHEADEDAEAMEALETRLLASIGIADPYA